VQRHQVQRQKEVGRPHNAALGRLGAGHQPSPGSKGSKTKPDAKLAKLEATALAEELKATVRAAKMMLRGVSYSQVVQAQAPIYVAPAQTSAPAPAPASAPRIVRTALTPNEAIAIFLETIKRLQIRKSPKTSSKHLYNLCGGQEAGKKLYA
jgi:hypothetical protein